MRTWIILALLLALSRSAGATEPQFQHLEKMRVRLKVSGALTLGLGLATAVAGSVIVGVGGLCGTEYGACQRQSTIDTFNAAFSMIGIGGASAVTGIVLLALSHKYRVQLERVRAGVAFIPSGAMATVGVRF